MKDDGRPDDYKEIIAHLQEERSDEEREAYAEGFTQYMSGGRWKSLAEISEDKKGDTLENGNSDTFSQVSTYLTWPDPNFISPRGRAGYDGLFFALLACRASLASTLSTVEEYRNNTNHSSAFILRSNGQTCFPLSGESFNGQLPQGRLVTLRRSTVIRDFFRTWTRVRKEANQIVLNALSKNASINRYGRYDGMITAADTDGDDNHPWDDEELARYLKSIGIPHDEGKDAWDTQRSNLLKKIDSSNEFALPAGNLRCPFCGPVRPLRVVLNSPSWTWEHLVGRGSDHLCCPGCLGDFGVVATRMN
jgi:hypothetical protein